MSSVNTARVIEAVTETVTSALRNLRVSVQDRFAEIEEKIAANALSFEEGLKKIQADASSAPPDPAKIELKFDGEALDGLLDKVISANGETIAGVEARVRAVEERIGALLDKHGAVVVELQKAVSEVVRDPLHEVVSRVAEAMRAADSERMADVDKLVGAAVAGVEARLAGDIQALTKEMESARAALDAAMSRSADQPSVDEVAARVAELVPAPKDAEPFVLTDELRASIVDEVAAKMPAPKDAEPFVLTDELRAAIVAEVSAKMPAPKDGKDGKSITIDDVHGAISKMVAEYPMPTAEDVASIIEKNVTQWELSFERRSQDLLQRAVDRIPVPRDGRDGRDAFSLDDFDADLLDDGRTIRLKFESNGKSVMRDLTLPVPAWKGYYKPDERYAKGDMLTHAGSLFMAMRDTDAKPETDDSWRLVVKRGRDGKRGDKGEKGDAGPRGQRGERGDVRHRSVDPFGVGEPMDEGLGD